MAGTNEKMPGRPLLFYSLAGCGGLPLLRLQPLCDSVQPVRWREKYIQDLTFVFGDASARLPPTHVTQVEIVKRRVPKGSVLIYFMEQSELWQFGLWKRSLYPDYVLIPVAGSAMLGSPEFAALWRHYQVRYVLLAGASLSQVNRKTMLPDYPKGIPIALAELEN